MSISGFLSSLSFSQEEVDSVQDVFLVIEVKSLLQWRSVIYE